MPGQLGEFQHAWKKLLHHPLVLRSAVSRVQGRQFDRDAGPAYNALSVGRLANRVNRVFIGLHVALRIGVCQCGFAQHVVGIAKALGFHGTGTLQCLVNRFAGYKLLTQHMHGQLHALADQRLAALADQSGKRSQHRTLAVRSQQLAREQQPPRRGVHKQRRAAAHMLAPVALADLVANQRIACGRVWNA